MMGDQAPLRQSLWLATITLLAASAQPLSACATCFGGDDSGMVSGAKAGVIALAIVVYGVLFSIAGVTGFWVFKAHKLAALQQASLEDHYHEAPSSIAENAHRQDG